MSTTNLQVTKLDKLMSQLVTQPIISNEIAVSNGSWGTNTDTHRQITIGYPTVTVGRATGNVYQSVDVPKDKRTASKLKEAYVQLFFEDIDLGMEDVSLPASHVDQFNQAKRQLSQTLAIVTTAVAIIGANEGIAGLLRGGMVKTMTSAEYAVGASAYAKLSDMAVEFKIKNKVTTDVSGYTLYLESKLYSLVGKEPQLANRDFTDNAGDTAKGTFAYIEGFKVKEAFSLPKGAGSLFEDTVSLFTPDLDGAVTAENLTVCALLMHDTDAVELLPAEYKMGNAVENGINVYLAEGNHNLPGLSMNVRLHLGYMVKNPEKIAIMQVTA